MTRQNRRISLLVLTGASIAVLVIATIAGQLTVPVAATLAGLTVLLLLLALPDWRASSPDLATDADNHLQTEAGLAQTLLDRVPDPAMVIGPDYRVAAMNRAAREAYGVDDAGERAIFCYRAIHRMNKPCAEMGRVCALLDGEAGKRIEKKVDKDGRSRLVEYRATPLCGTDEEITGVVEVAHELNERELLALQLGRDKDAAELATRVKSEFLATMSHEIRTPMNAVLGMTDLLRLTDLTRKQQGYLQTIQSSGDMLLSLLDNVVDYSQLDEGGPDLCTQEFDVANLMERVLQIMGYQAYSNGLELIADYPVASPLRVHGDNERLRQILVNLVGNSIRFSDAGEIVIELTTETGDAGEVVLRFTVTDRGAGMTRELRESLSAPLGALGINAHSAQQGAGLGLTISRRLIERMGGTIGADSVAGEGTTVSFTVPVERVEDEPGERKKIVTKLKDLDALVAHGNPLVAAIVCRYLEAWGLDCDTAADANAALSKLDGENAEKYGIAIVDAELPGNDGMFLSRQIRARTVTADLPIVLLTSIARPLEVGEISSVGNIRCVNKPILPSELRHNLLRLTGRDTEFAADTIVSGTAAIPARQLRILIAEDNRVNGRMLRSMLCSLGHYPDMVGDGRAALRALAGEAYDLVLMDGQMPGLDGDQITKRLRSNPASYRSQPVVIAVTADNSEEHRRRCLDAGMDGFIAKPIRLDKLQQGLERWPQLLGFRPSPDTDETGGETGAGTDEIEARVRRQISDRAGSRGSDFAIRYIDLFLNDTAARLDNLNVALEAKDTEALGRESHALKGACLEFGVERMGRYCDKLRMASIREKLHEAARIMAMMRKEFVRVRRVFEAEKTASRL